MSTSNAVTDQQLQVLTPPSHLVVLWVKQFGQLVKDEARVSDRAPEDMVDRSVEMMGSQYSVCRSKPRPDHQHWV